MNMLKSLQEENDRLRKEIDRLRKEKRQREGSLSDWLTTLNVDEHDNVVVECLGRKWWVTLLYDDRFLLSALDSYLSFTVFNGLPAAGWSVVTDEARKKGIPP